MIVERVSEPRQLPEWPHEQQCPPTPWLDGLMLGTLHNEQQQQLETHVADCTVCQQRLLDATGCDSIECLARECLTAGNEAGLDEADRAVVGKLIDRMGHLPDEGMMEDFHRQSAVDLAARLAELQPFFDPPTCSDSLGTIDRFEIVEVLGAGATGIVFRARQTSLDRFVVLKVLRPSLGAQARERFLHEARAAAAIEHDNVVAILEVGQWRDLAFFTMPWLPGETLQARLDRERVLDPEEVITITRQIAAGLAVAHRHGMVHRDVKPANIWIEESTGRVRLLDFGLARITDDDQHFTQTGMVAGTPGYMSPQQAVGEPIDPRSDLFSLGCVMYRMAAGRMAFVAPNVLATLQLIRTHHPVPAREVNPNVPAELSLLIECLLSKDPNQRPQTAEQVIAALESPPRDWPFALSGQRMVDPVQPATDASGGMSRWRRIGRGIGLGLVCLAFGGLVWLFTPQVIRIATDRGVVEIKTDDPDIQIDVLQEGRLVRVIDTRSTQQFEIRSGEYALRGVAPDSEVQLSTDRLVVKRGGKQVVEARLLPAAPALAADATESPSSRPEPLWDGKPVSEYLRLLRAERRPERLVETLHALNALYSPRYQEDFTAALTEIVRDDFIGNLNDRAGFYYDALAELITRLPPRDQVDLLLTYLRSARRNPGTWVDHWLWRLRINEQVHQELQQRRDEVLDAFMRQIPEGNGSSDAAWANAIAVLLAGTHISVDDRPDVVELLARDLSSASIDRLVVLAQFAPDTPELADRIVELLSNQRFYGSDNDTGLVEALLALGPQRYDLEHLLRVWNQIRSEIVATETGPGGGESSGLMMGGPGLGAPRMVYGSLGADPERVVNVVLTCLRAIIDYLDSHTVSPEQLESLKEAFYEGPNRSNYIASLKQVPVPAELKQQLLDLNEELFKKLSEIMPEKK